jgi:hypothetical protein
MTTIIELTPCSRARNTRKPPTPRYRHIVCIANRQLRSRFPKNLPSAGGFRSTLCGSPGRPARRPYFYRLPIDMQYVALHQENYATIANYLERELRYMDAGE